MDLIYYLKRREVQKIFFNDKSVFIEYRYRKIIYVKNEEVLSKSVLEIYDKINEKEIISKFEAYWLTINIKIVYSTNFPLLFY